MATGGPVGELHAQNPTGRFTHQAGDYARHRPSYPPAAIDAILAGLDLSQIAVADIGAGTGISTRLVADRLFDGGRVFAIEPNDAMRGAAAPHGRVSWIQASAERTTLPDADVDVVVCAQAFHWFRAEEALAEFHRILRPAGRLALMWNERDPSDAMTDDYGRLILTASANHPAAQRVDRPEALFRTPLFRDIRQMRFPFEQSLDAEGLIGRALSASYVPREGPARETLVTGLRELHARYADAEGRVRLVYVTQVYVAQRA